MSCCSAKSAAKNTIDPGKKGTTAPKEQAVPQVQATPAVAVPKPVEAPPSPPQKEPFPKRIGAVKVYGVPVSLNALGPYMLCSAVGCGELVQCVPGEGTQTSDFLKLNPFHAIPTIEDGGLSLAESGAILRYLAEKYVPEAYPKADPKRRAFIDWALERFSSNTDAFKTIYPRLGFAPAPEDQAAAGKTCTENLEEYAKVFLREKFIGGQQLSIADFKVAPAFFAYSHPFVAEDSKVVIPDRIKQFNADFAEAFSRSQELLQGLKGFLDDKSGKKDVKMLTDYKPCVLEAEDILKAKTTEGKGNLDIYGVPVSTNSDGPILFAKHMQLGEMVLCVPGDEKGTRAPEFGELNPFRTVPMLKDGDFSLGESNAILRYMAENYAIEYFPDDPAKRAFINWAMDRFSSTMLKDVNATLNVILGHEPEPAKPEDLVEAGKKTVDNLNEFANHFLKDTFIGGKTLSIADFKVAPFFYAYSHPALKQRCELNLPDRIRQFNDDFASASKTAKFLREVGGWALKEQLDSKSSNDLDGGVMEVGGHQENNCGCALM